MDMEQQNLKPVERPAEIAQITGAARREIGYYNDLAAVRNALRLKRRVPSADVYHALGEKYTAQEMANLDRDILRLAKAKGATMTRSEAETVAMIDAAAAPQMPKAKSNAERQAKFVEARNEIGDLPAIEQGPIIAHITADPVWACWYYFPAIFYRRPSMLSKTIIAKVWNVMLHGGNQSVGVVRSAGKSTITKALILLAGLCGIIKYAVIFGSMGDKAQELLQWALKQLETNDLLLADFPNACIPIRKCEGIPQRAKTQRYHGRRDYLSIKANEVQLADIDNFPANRFILKTLGIKSGFLGLVKDELRPDFVLADDIQSIKDSKSDKYIAALEQSTRQGLQGLGGDKRPLRIVQLVTCTRAGDYSDRILDTDLYPEYSGVRLGLVNCWGSDAAQDLWARYCDKWRECQRAGDKAFKAATDFYRDNRAAMDDGVEVSDPDFYAPSIELSTIQRAWNMRLAMGDESYFAQCENHPISLGATIYELTPKKVAESLNGLARGVCPAGTIGLFGFADVMLDKFRWTIVAVSGGMRIAIIDYGTWPDRGAVAPKNATEQQQMSAIWQCQATLCAHIASRVYTREGAPGAAMRLVAFGFDRGYHPDAVQGFCAARSTSYPFPLLAMRGLAENKYRPTANNVILQSFNSYLVRTIGGSAPGDFLNERTDWWKEVVQRSFLCASADAPGACTFWGDDPRTHSEFADNVCAETLADKGRGMNGSEFWRWVLRPGAKNHYLDSLVGCFALAGYYRYYMPDTSAQITGGASLPDVQIKQAMRRVTSSRRHCSVPIND